MMLAARRRLLASALLAAIGVGATAAEPPPGPPDEVAAELAGARLLGSGELRFMGLRIYGARLWAGPERMPADWWTAPFALELLYRRDLKGEQIAERSLKEMKRQGDLSSATSARWLPAMKQLFPDVKEGDRIVGINMPGKGARFYFNGAAQSPQMDGEFARVFFGIWLSPRSSEPALREALLARGGS